LQHFLRTNNPGFTVYAVLKSKKIMLNLQWHQ